MELSIESAIKSLCLKHFDQVGFAAAGRPSTMDFYEKWIAEGRHGEMGYLARHQERKASPQLLLDGAKTWIALTLNYDTQEPLSIDLQEEFKRDKKGWIARYARGRDYHDEIRERHDRLIANLKEMFPGEEFLGCVDTKAVLERDVAARAGLGWIGKNTCLINKDMGSFVFLSEILTTLDLESDKPVMDHCGTCTKCLEACPTGALTPRQMDATKCISYWTIEVNQPPPQELASKFGNQLFGCDICQDVCPWNQKSRRSRALPVIHESGTVALEELVKAPPEEIKARLQASAMSRAKPDQIKRNALNVLKNQIS